MFKIILNVFDNPIEILLRLFVLKMTVKETLDTKDYILYCGIR